MFVSAKSTIVLSISENIIKLGKLCITCGGCVTFFEWLASCGNLLKPKACALSVWAYNSACANNLSAWKKKQIVRMRQMLLSALTAKGVYQRLAHRPCRWSFRARQKKYTSKGSRAQLCARQNGTWKIKYTRVRETERNAENEVYSRLQISGRFCAEPVLVRQL